MLEMEGMIILRLIYLLVGKLGDVCFVTGELYLILK